LKTIRSFSLLLVWAIILLQLIPGAALAQDNPSPGPIYVVQAGDTLWAISQRFGVTLDDLINANNLVDANNLNAGDELIIPGLEGVQGRLETRLVTFGESLRSLSRKYQTPVDQLARLNRLSSPAEMYAGNNLIVQQAGQDSPVFARRAVLKPGQSLLELAVLQGVSPWNLAAWNDFPGTWAGAPGDVLHLPGEDPGPGALPPEITSLTLDPLPFIQGATERIRLETGSQLSLYGQFQSWPLTFFKETENQYIAMQGVHALTEPGVYPFSISGASADGSSFSFTQYVQVSDGGYVYDPVLYVDPATIDPQVTRPEDVQWIALAAPVTPEKMWSEVFEAPVAPEFASCYPSLYGNRRSYNDGGYNAFHTGLDFCGAVGNPIFAPAAGVVVFAGSLSVRGNATVIDHGWGVYTGYMHQSEIQVQVGQRVAVGDQIGLVGRTGRVTGPHLHFEVWVGGVQVEPQVWLQEVFP
jgi:murein DD-endopeptidase MepM/ murein hydrolase activator NlpD